MLAEMAVAVGGQRISEVGAIVLFNDEERTRSLQRLAGLTLKKPR